MSSKSPDAFRTISEVADWLGVQPHVLRFWESKFSQVKPVKRAGGRRYFRPGDMLLLGGIRKLLHEDGLTIKGVQKVLREQGMGHVSAMSKPLDPESAGLIDAQDESPFVEAPEEMAAQSADVVSLTDHQANSTQSAPQQRALALPEGEADAPSAPAQVAAPLPTSESESDDAFAAMDTEAARAEPQPAPEQPLVLSPAERKPKIIDAPDPDESSIHVSPSTLSAAFSRSVSSSEQKAKLQELAGQLASWRYRMSSAAS